MNPNLDLLYLRKPGIYFSGQFHKPDWMEWLGHKINPFDTTHIKQENGLNKISNQQPTNRALVKAIALAIVFFFYTLNCHVLPKVDNYLKNKKFSSSAGLGMKALLFIYPFVLPFFGRCLLACSRSQAEAYKNLVLCEEVSESEVQQNVEGNLSVFFDKGNRCFFSYLEVDGKKRYFATYFYETDFGRDNCFRTFYFFDKDNQRYQLMLDIEKANNHLFKYNGKIHKVPAIWPLGTSQPYETVSAMAHIEPTYIPFNQWQCFVNHQFVAYVELIEDNKKSITPQLMSAMVAPIMVV
jgi:hypothetical protein